MTPEEINRAMEFIVQHQAHLSASLDREQAMREESQREFKESQRKLATLQIQVVEMIRIESARLDRHDEVLGKHEEAQLEAQRRFDEFMRETRAWQQVWQEESRREAREAQKRHEEALARLDRILDRLSGKPN
jgi:hypothetical protein